MYSCYAKDINDVHRLEPMLSKSAFANRGAATCRLGVARIFFLFAPKNIAEVTSISWNIKYEKPHFKKKKSYVFLARFARSHYSETEWLQTATCLKSTIFMHIWRRGACINYIIYLCWLQKSVDYKNHKNGLGQMWQYINWCILFCGKHAICFTKIKYQNIFCFAIFEDASC